MPDDQGHLRPRDVRDLVQDDHDDPVRPGHHARHHPPLPLHRVRERLRGDALRQVRQGRADLGARIERPSSTPPPATCNVGALPQRCSPSSLKSCKPQACHPTDTMYAFTQRTPGRTARRDSRGRAVQERTRHRHAPGRSDRRGRTARGAQLLREQLPRPGQRSATVVAAAKASYDRWGYGLSTVRFICGTQALHKELEARISRVPRHRGHDPLQLVLRRQRRAVRDAARAGGRDHQRRAEPRQHHRRHPALQGPAAPLQEQRHGRPRGAAPGGRRRPAAARSPPTACSPWTASIANARRASATWPTATTPP